MEKKLLFRLQLIDPMGNGSTLKCYVVGQEILYSLYSGWGTSGTAQYLGNLQCNLPVSEGVGMTVKEFEDEVCRVIVNEGVHSVANRIQPTQF